MGKSADEESRRRSTVPMVLVRPNIRKKVWHPFVLRLKDSAAFSVTTPQSLISAGYASIAMGLFSGFRPTPLLLAVFAYQYQEVSSDLNVNRAVLFCVLLIWFGLISFVLVILGMVLAASQRITKRWPLLLHPWGLLLLYFDIFVWLSLTLWLHVQVLMYPDYEGEMFYKIHHPRAFFIGIYVECILIGIFHYVYATYFLAAELTLIEKFF